MPNLSSVGPTVWPHIENRHTHTQSPLLYRLVIAPLPGVVLQKGKRVSYLVLAISPFLVAKLPYFLVAKLFGRESGVTWASLKCIWLLSKPFNVTRKWRDSNPSYASSATSPPKATSTNLITISIQVQPGHLMLEFFTQFGWQVYIKVNNLGNPLHCYAIYPVLIYFNLNVYSTVDWNHVQICCWP